MNREFVFTMRDVVNLFLIYVPALLGWVFIIYCARYRIRKDVTALLDAMARRKRG